MKRFRNIALTILILVAVIIVTFGITYNVKLAPISNSDEVVKVAIPVGTVLNDIGDILEEKELIKSAFFFNLYLKLNNITEIEAASYKLTPDMGVKKMVATLLEGGVGREEVNITFREGLNMRAVARIIENNTFNSYDEVMNKIADKDYLKKLIDKYWFLEDEILDEDIYYPLEGYLFPETYRIYEDSSVATIFEKMLDHTSIILEKYKSKIETSDYSIHEILTLASIVELEGASSNDRAKVAGVFYNRLKSGWTLGSDVTGYYGAKMDDWTKGLGSHINDCNAYNTRGTCVSKLPVGPICNPGESSIKATLYPSPHSYYYFVADCKGNTYLNKTESGHNNTIATLKSEGNWCDM